MKGRGNEGEERRGDGGRGEKLSIRRKAALRENDDNIL